MWQYNGRTIKEGKSWISADGIKHPTNWAVWSDEVKKSFGLIQVDDPKTWDNRFYWGWDSEEKNLIERKIDDEDATDGSGNKLKDEKGNQVINYGLKSVAIVDTKTTARTKLSDSDWYITRKTETGTEIPTAVSTYRAAVRTACKTIEDAITACDTLTKFMALYDVPVDKDGNVTGNAPIHDWPDEI